MRVHRDAAPMLAAHYSRIRVHLCRLSAGTFSKAQTSRLPGTAVLRYSPLNSPLVPVRCGPVRSRQPLPHEKDAGPDQLDEEKERPGEPTPEPANLRPARLEPDFRVNEQHDAFASELRSNSCHFDTYIIHAGLERQATVCRRPFPYPWPFTQFRDQIPVGMGTAVAGLRQCRIRNRRFQRVRRCLEKDFSAGL